MVSPKIDKRALQLLEPPPTTTTTYDIVVHVRLEDFALVNMVSHPSSLIAVLEQIVSQTNDTSPIAVVVNRPRNEAEQRYLNEFLSHPGFGSRIRIESNDVLVDFHIMQRAKTLVCSLSTLSWSAALLSTTVGQIYFPRNGLNDHQRPPALDRQDDLIVSWYDNKLCSTW